jgi:small subunit ribosomal protein S2
MASLVKDLIDSGIHYGHRTAGWNPKMEPYIYGKKNGIHIIDVRQTIKGLLLAKKFLTRTVANGKDVLFVGTKRQARPAIEGACGEVSMPYVTERWLGGTLTNFRTIRSRLKRLEELEQLMSSEDWENYSKKMASQLIRERKKIERNLGGIRTLDRLPGAIVVVDVRREINALREARTLGIPTVCLLDTDGDPDMVDIPIPGNDDAMRAIDVIVKQLAEAAGEGKTARAQKDKARGEGEGGEEGGRPRRRSARTQFRAEDATDAPTAGDEAQDLSPQQTGDDSPVPADHTGQPTGQAAPSDTPRTPGGDEHAAPPTAENQPTESLDKPDAAGQSPADQGQAEVRTNAETEQSQATR